jgi:hypothetical protein
MIPTELWKVLTPDERIYLAALFHECEKDQTLDEFAATTKAILAVFLRDPRAKVSFEISARDEHDPEKALRAKLTPEENARLTLTIRGET